MAQKIEIVRGTTNTFNITVLDADGQTHELVTGEKIIFGVKRKPADTEFIFTKTGVKDTDGTFNVGITPADTIDLAFGRYFYDVGLQSGDNYFNVIEASPFMVKENVTHWGCAD